MKKRAFTMLEIIIICIIVGILATLAYPYVQNVLEKSKAEVCATNLKALQKAVEIYIRENDAVPATLGALPRKDVDKAFAELMQERGAWKRRLAFFIKDAGERGLLYAASQYFPKLRCPKALPGEDSYMLMIPFSVTTASAYAAMHDDFPVVGDRVPRHRVFFSGTWFIKALAVSKNGYSGCAYSPGVPLQTGDQCFGFPAIPCNNCAY